MVQSKSKFEDVRALMYAKHLAVGAMSNVRKFWTVSTRILEFIMIHVVHVPRKAKHTVTVLPVLGRMENLFVSARTLDLLGRA